jgi:hypothetical protein
MPVVIMSSTETQKYLKGMSTIILRDIVVSHR